MINKKVALELTSLIQFILKDKKTIDNETINRTLKIMSFACAVYSHQRYPKYSPQLHMYHHYNRKEIRDQMNQFCEDYMIKNYGWKRTKIK